MWKFIKIFMVVLLLSTNLAFSDEIIVDFEEDSVAVLNEELRLKEVAIKDLESKVSTLESATDQGSILQVVNVMDGAVATGTTVLPYDDTIPQNTEGDEYMTLAVTPTSATNKLKIDVVLNTSHSKGGKSMVALFQDATAGALAVVIESNTNINLPINFKLTHYMTAGTTSATTFKIRAGGSVVGTTTFNGVASGRLFGGLLASSITITEIAQ